MRIALIALIDETAPVEPDLEGALASALDATVLSFRGVAQAKASAEASEVDAVVVRCSAQTTTPGALIDEIRAFWSEVPLIVVSSPGADENGISAASLGVDAWIVEDPRCALRVAAALTRAVEQNLRRRQLQALNAIASEVNRSLHLAHVLDAALDQVERALAVEACAIYLLEGDPPLLRLRAWRGLPDDLVHAADELGVGEGFSGGIVASDQPLLVDDIGADSRLTGLPIAQAGFHFFAGVPLHAARRITGTLFVGSRVRPTQYDLLRFLTNVGGQVGTAIENARLYQEADVARRQWQETFDAIEDGISIVGGDHRIIQANRAFMRLMDGRGGRVLGAPCYALIHGLEAPPENCVRQCLLRGERPEPMEIRLAGNARQVVCSTYPKRDSEGRLEGVVHVFRDVTEVRRLHDQVAQADKLTTIGELLASVAHELNNPLAAVGGLSELLLRQGEPLPPRLRDDLSAIAQEAARAVRIVRNLLAFSRRAPMAMEAVDLHDCLRRSLELLDYHFKVDNIRVEMDSQPDLPAVMGDRDHLQQVIVNLFSNARHVLAQLGGGVLSVRTAAQGEMVRLEIADTGPGIPEEDLGRVFDPFFTTKPLGEGTGLGLSICRAIIAQHSGRIEVTNRPEGGVLCVVELPRAPQPARVLPPCQPGLVSSVADARVLVVDDEPLVRRFILRALEIAGHDAAAADNAEQALDLLRREAFDVVVCDLKMPGAGGRGFYRSVISEHAEMAGHIIFCTGDTLRPTTHAFLKEVGAPCLFKPFTTQQLLDAVRSGSAGRREAGGDASS